MKKISSISLVYIVLLLAMTPLTTLARHTIWDGGTIIFNVPVSNALLLSGGVVLLGFVIGFALRILVTWLHKIAHFASLKTRLNEKRSELFSSPKI